MQTALVSDKYLNFFSIISVAIIIYSLYYMVTWLEMKIAWTLQATELFLVFMKNNLRYALIVNWHTDAVLMGFFLKISYFKIKILAKLLCLVYLDAKGLTRIRWSCVEEIDCIFLIRENHWHTKVTGSMYQIWCLALIPLADLGIVCCKI